MGAYPSGANGYATVDARRPVAFAICDRCGFRRNRNKLSWQYEWAGAELQNLRILVCNDRNCYDIPNEQLRSYSPPADPVPIIDPRPDLALAEMGSASVVTTIVFTPTIVLRDGFGNPVLDGFGNPIILVAGTWGTLLAASPGRTFVEFMTPIAFGMWYNFTGGTCGPALPNCVFYPPDTPVQIKGAAAASAMTYFTTVPNMTVVLETQ